MSTPILTLSKRFSVYTVQVMHQLTTGAMFENFKRQRQCYKKQKPVWLTFLCFWCVCFFIVTLLQGQLPNKGILLRVLTQKRFGQNSSLYRQSIGVYPMPFFNLESTCRR